MGTLNSRPQRMQTASAGVVLSHLASDPKAALDHVQLSSDETVKLYRVRV
jgi:hypothetical protein